MKFNTKYNLRRQDSKKPEKIYLVCRWNGEKMVYPTSFNVVPKHWNAQKHEIRNVIEELNRDKINTYLKELKTVAKGFFENAIVNNTPIHEIKPTIKNDLDKWTGKVVEVKATFWGFVLDYVANSKTRLDPKTGRTINARTIQEYNTTIKLLQAFEIANRQKLDFNNIDLNTLTDFRDYLTTVKKFAVNNIAKHIDNLRQFLRNANAQKIAIDTDTIDNKKFTNARELAYNVYLNEKELQQITALNLTDNERLDKARDLFLIGCFTGLRVSDYNNIKPHNIKGNTLEVYQSKTGGRIVIPIHPTVKKILAKYDNNTPPKISDQRLNEYIKEVCQQAKIIEQTEKQQTKGGEKVKTVLEKWQMISSHTARRSFATNAVKQGIPIQTVMKITGHQKEATFLKYVKLSANEHAEIMAKHWNDLQILNKD